MPEQQAGIRRTLIILGVIVTFFTIAGVALLPRTATPSLAPQTVRVEYRVAGDAPVTVEFLNDLGFGEERALTPPWVYGFRARPIRELQLVVQRSGGAGSIGCTIAINGVPVQEVTTDESAARCTFVLQ
jgi:hypothetical protein